MVASALAARSLHEQIGASRIFNFTAALLIATRDGIHDYKDKLWKTRPQKSFTCAVRRPGAVWRQVPLTYDAVCPNVKDAVIKWWQNGVCVCVQNLLGGPQTSQYFVTHCVYVSV